MKVSLQRINDDYLFEARGESGVPVRIDNKTEKVSQGASPMELLLMGVGGCSAVDIISILKKQRQQITSYTVEVDGTRKTEKEAKPFTAMEVSIFLEGTIDPEKAKKAAALSFEKYCSVSITLEPVVAITYKISVNGVFITL